MGMLALAHPIGINLARVLGRSNRTRSRAVADLNVLLKRIRQRLYPESVPVLASWWLKTVYHVGHNRVWWAELDAAITEIPHNQLLDARAGEAIKDIQTWVRRAILPRHKAPEVRPLITPPFRPDLTPD